MVTFIKFNQSVDLSDYTLIIPSVSVGNVPQLTVDLIISNFDLIRCATIWDLGIIPAVGGDPFDKDSKELCTACEVYYSSELKLAALQLRSGLETRYLESFCEKLKTEIIKLKFKNIFLLSSFFAHEMHDIMTSKYRYLSSEFDNTVFKERNILELDLTIGDYKTFGAGFTIKLYELLNENLKSTLLVKYVSEGDNIPDALNMLELLMTFIPMLNDQSVLKHIVYPISWDHVFGNPPPTGIY